MSSFGHLRGLYGRLLFACGLLAGAVTFLMMVLVVANAILRFAFNAPIGGTLELTESMLTVLIFMSLALTQYEGGHIHVVLLTDRLPAAARRAARFVAMVAGLGFFAWCSYAAWLFAMRSYAMDEHEWGSISFPLYPVKFVIFAGLGLLTIQFLLDAVSVVVALADVPDEPTDSVETM